MTYRKAAQIIFNNWWMNQSWDMESESPRPSEIYGDDAFSIAMKMAYEMLMEKANKEDKEDIEDSAMEWYDYQAEKRRVHNIFNDNQTWLKTKAKCPNCGNIIYKNISYVLTTYPERYTYKCPACNWSQTGY